MVAAHKVRRSVGFVVPLLYPEASQPTP